MGSCGYAHPALNRLALRCPGPEHPCESRQLLGAEKIRNWLLPCLAIGCPQLPHKKDLNKLERVKWRSSRLLSQGYGGTWKSCQDPSSEVYSRLTCCPKNILVCTQKPPQEAAAAAAAALTAMPVKPAMLVPIAAPGPKGTLNNPYNSFNLFSLKTQKKITRDFASKECNMLAKQSQLPQPLLIRLLLQTLHQLHCPSLDTLQHLNVSLVVRGPKLNTVFEVRHQCRVQGHDHFPTPAGHAIFDTSQDAIGFLGHLGTLPAHIQLAINQYPQVLFRQAAFQPLFPKPVALHGVAVAQVQDPALILVEPHTIHASPSIQPVWIPLQSLPTLKQINTPAQLGVICKLTEGALDPFVQIIDKDIKQNWPQHRALGNTTCDRLPTGVNSIHHHSLGPAIQPVLYPAKSTPVQAMSSQFLQENAVGTRVKGFTEV
ncbi:hypothetical protein QYF61_001455 [Mycteria americana]|uniref:Uncharacterized protein n=1 Tax=Mycteria americana TaxID=33587 RepID=A0AAN7NNX8_MYCAM|nr:hypothetical protein QYF61_001455 [Mycteria americana]